MIFIWLLGASKLETNSLCVSFQEYWYKIFGQNAPLGVLTKKMGVLTKKGRFDHFSKSLLVKVPFLVKTPIIGQNASFWSKRPMTHGHWTLDRPQVVLVDICFYWLLICYGKGSYFGGLGHKLVEGLLRLKTSFGSDIIQTRKVSAQKILGGRHLVMMTS